MKRGLTARPRTILASAASRARARGRLRIGGIEHDEIGLASERGRGRREAADMRRVLGAFEQIARGIVAAMQQQIGGGDPRGERAGQRRAFAFRAAIAMRRGGEIGGADRRAVAVLAEQLLDARAISAGRGAEDAREPGAIAARGARAAASGFSSSSSSRSATSLHRGVEQRDLRREQVAEQAGDAPGHIDARASHRGAAAAPRCR